MSQNEEYKEPQESSARMEDPLLSNEDNSRGYSINDAADPDLTPGGVLWRFMYFGICFSINHGCVTSVIGLASSVLPDDLAGAQLGTLYVTYSLTALFGSAAMVTTFGSKWSLFVSTFMYCTYVACFLFATIDDVNMKWGFALVGAFIGGVAAGNLWTAQGAYFGETAKVYAEVTGEPTTVATGLLAGYFASQYLFFECALKLITPAIIAAGGSKEFLFAMYTILAVASAVGMVFIRDVSDKNQPKRNWSDACSAKKATGAIRLLVSDPRMPLLYPVCATFGVLAAFLNFYVNGKIVKPKFGVSYVGYLGATVTAVAGICSLAFSRIANQYGKGMLLVLGQLCFFGEALFCLIFDNDQLGHYLPLFLLYTVHGVGRSIYESTTRAVFADMWPDKSVQPFAFANIIISNGMTSATMFFIDPYLSKEVMCGIGLGSAACGVVGFYFTQRFEASHEFRETVVIKEDIE